MPFTPEEYTNIMRNAARELENKVTGQRGCHNCFYFDKDSRERPCGDCYEKDNYSEFKPRETPEDVRAKVNDDELLTQTTCPTKMLEQDLGRDQAVHKAVDDAFQKTYLGTEQDPTGLDAHAPGAKMDAGKARVGLMLNGFANALQSVADVTTFGANKYSPGGWLHVENAEERYFDALGRHLLKLEQGEETDPDSGLSHRAHIAWNALALLELNLRKL